MGWIERLRSQTRDLHKTAHALPFFHALWEKALPLESYVGQLRCLAVVHAALERHIAARAPREPFRSLLNGHRPKVPLLLQDLELFRNPPVLDVLPAVEKALNIADRIMTLSQENEIALVGYFYTLEGSTLGGRVMGPKVQETFDLPEGRGTSFFGCYGNDLQARWSAFLGALARSISHAEAQEGVIAASAELFRSLIGVYEALYPFQADQLGQHVVSLNPEAGRHPIPFDAVELEAALKAARRCWNAFPYFEMRYSDRGRRFAQSDAAWLAALCDLDGQAVVEQVVWLADLLAARGIPTWLTDTQVRMLHEELMQARPTEHSRYDRLLLAANALAGRRSAAPSGESIENFARELRDRFPVNDPNWEHLALILAAATGDSASGLPGTPGAIVSWIRETRGRNEKVLEALTQFLELMAKDLS